MDKVFADYYIGLDIGTNSVGWAVTDTNYNLLKFNRKSMWGVRLFKSGETAAARRVFRASRRRLARKKQRISLLQEIFRAEMEKIDPDFFNRMKESHYNPSDKPAKYFNTLFGDKDFSDKNYHLKYPTIYHLRKSLLDGEKHDIRLLYLAIHHILKNRGHFLFAGQNLENITSFNEAFGELCTYLKDEFDFDLSCKDLANTESIIKCPEMGKKEKRKALEEMLYAEKNYRIKAIISAIIGSKFELSDLYDDESLKDSEINKADLSGASYEEAYDKIHDVLEERIGLIDNLKRIYDWSVLASIRKGHKYLSESKTEAYNKHKRDLKRLKELVKKYYPAKPNRKQSEKYKEVFSSEIITGNYPSYIGTAKKNKVKIPVEKKCSYEVFCKYIKSIFKDFSTEEDVKEILIEIENKTFLPKQVCESNSVIPYQMHKEELKVILEKASEYLKFLNDRDETGFSGIDKIISLLEFRIPYYVGPLNCAHKDQGANCWIVKRTNDKIRPWNFNSVVDLEKSAENFILRMTKKCTYLKNKDVVPKYSLLYSKYSVLNELNNLTVNGEKISTNLKKKIYNDLFKTKKKVLLKNVKNLLKSEGILCDTDDIGGIDGDFKSSLTSYIDFSAILPPNKLKEDYLEKIIRYITLFGEDKKILRNKISTDFKDFFTNEEISKILRLKYTGWGAFSKEFLTQIEHVDLETGECISIIDALYETNNNLMQLLSSKFSFSERIDDYIKKNLNLNEKLEYDAVKELYVSPAIKRGIWQTIKVVKEIVKITKKHPLKIFIEVARETRPDKGRTESRKNRLIELYKKCKEEARDWVSELTNYSEGNLRSKKLFLYYTQMGRCMYTGKSIELSELSELSNENIYDIDHIYPRSKVKDDSLDNLVLVKRVENIEKRDAPLSYSIQNKMRDFWRSLLQKGLISKTKYDRLIRSGDFTDDELSVFINRQLVETRQSTKAVAELLSRRFDNNIVYVKAGNVSEFRNFFEITKVRDINDYHHAKDAYLNIVVGNIYDTKFTRNPLNFIRSKEGRNYSLNLKTMLKYNISAGGINAWVADNNQTINTVRALINKNNILFTRHAYKEKGGLFDQQLLKKGKWQFPIKKSDKKLLDLSKYGGYSKVKGSYFFVVEHTKTKGKKNERIKSIEYFPIYLCNKKGPKDLLIDYCVSELGLIEPRIIVDCIKIDTLFSIDSYKCHLSSRTSDRIVFKNANQLILSEADEKIIKKILKFNQRISETSDEPEVSSYDDISAENNIRIWSILLDKLKNTVYRKQIPVGVKNVCNSIETYKKLSLAKQCDLIEKLLSIFKCSSVTTDLSIVGGGKQSGRIDISKYLTDGKIKLIYQSATGLFEKEVSL